MTTSEQSTEFVQSLARGLEILRAFDADHPRLRASEVATRASVPRAAARRFLHTLVELGYVVSDGQHYRLSPRVLELGGGYLAALRLDEIAQPHLQSLSEAVGESVSAATLDGQHIVYVARAPTRRIMSVNIAVGTRFPTFATAMGRVLVAATDEQRWEEHLGLEHATRFTERTVVDRTALLSELARVRSAGWAEVDGELEVGLRSIAVPAALPDGQVLALNIAFGPMPTRPELSREHAIALLQDAAERVTQDALAIASRR